jgi:hypothetical protein
MNKIRIVFKTTLNQVYARINLDFICATTFKHKNKVNGNSDVGLNIIQMRWQLGDLFCSVLHELRTNQWIFVLT